MLSPSPAKPERSESQQLGLRELVAMGIGGMVGGGIFSVLGLSVSEAGHAAPGAFALGGLIALCTGYSYSRLGLHFHSDGGSFTYLEHAFRHPNIAGIGGWLLLAGYIGTLSLYAFTFGAYGTAIFGDLPSPGWIRLLRHVLASGVLLAFLAINLRGVRAAGSTEDAIVVVKVAILAFFVLIGLTHLRADHLLPVFDRGQSGLLMGSALIFVAYEGFELIPNSVNEMKHPTRDLPRAITISIVVTLAIYVGVTLVAIGNLLPDELARQREYALAVAARPILGQAGFLMIGLGAVLSTASAINATLFGTARLSMVMANDGALPRVFGCRERSVEIPWVSLVAITGLTLAFVNTSDLTMISAFASSTFLLIFASIHLAAFRLRHEIAIPALLPLAGLVLTTGSFGVLCVYLWRSDPASLGRIGVGYLAVAIAELAFSERRVIFWLRPRPGPAERETSKEP